MCQEKPVTRPIISVGGISSFVCLVGYLGQRCADRPKHRFKVFAAIIFI